MTARIVDIPGRGRARETTLADGTLRREYLDATGRIPGDGQSLTLIGGGGPRPRAAEAASLPMYLPDLPATSQVTLSSAAVQAIRSEVRSAAVAFDFQPVESGGWLLSDKRWPDRILVATKPGEDARYGRSNLFLGFDQAEAILSSYPHLHLRGCWHLHPSGAESPSQVDRRSWARGRDLVGHYWVSLIVTPARSGWEQPTLHGWLTTPDFTERLRVVEL